MKNTKSKKIDSTIIIGGGASGLMCAAALVHNGYMGNVTILEAQKRTGKKLLATGNGRCNLLNKNISKEMYSGSGKDGAWKIISQYNTQYMVKYFADMGLNTVCDSDGRYYPKSNSANSVLDLLRLYISNHENVKEVCQQPVLKIEKQNSKYKVTCQECTYTADAVVFAGGGKASQKLCYDGSCYKLLKDMGICINSLLPSLCPVKVNSPSIRSIKGLRVKGDAALWADGVCLQKESGEIQFGDGTLSGICVFQLSRKVNEFFTKNTINGKKIKEIKITLDLFPEYSQQETFDLIKKRYDIMQNYTIESFFTGLLQKRIGNAILKESGITDLSAKASSLSVKQLQHIANKLKCWSFSPRCISDFNNAQITGGGAAAEEINFDTMESKRYNRLYIIGETADIDGMCGGYNLHWAWASALTAAKHIAQGEI